MVHDKRIMTVGGCPSQEPIVHPRTKSQPLPQGANGFITVHQREGRDRGSIRAETTLTCLLSFGISASPVPPGMYLLVPNAGRLPNDMIPIHKSLERDFLAHFFLIKPLTTSEKHFFIIIYCFFFISCLVGSDRKRQKGSFLSSPGSVEAAL